MRVCYSSVFCIKREQNDAAEVPLANKKPITLFFLLVVNKTLSRCLNSNSTSPFLVPQFEPFTL